MNHNAAKIGLIESLLIIGLVVTMSILVVYVGQADRLEAYNQELVCDNMSLLEEIGEVKTSHAFMLSELSFMSGAITGHLFEDLTAMNVERMGRTLRLVLEDKKSVLEMEGER